MFEGSNNWTLEYSNIWDLDHFIVLLAPISTTIDTLFLASKKFHSFRFIR